MIVRRAGATYALGPVAPFGMHLRATAVLALKEACQDDPAVLSWLQAATQHAEVVAPREALQQKDFWRVTSSLLRVAPHHTPGRVVALQVRKPYHTPQVGIRAAKRSTHDGRCLPRMWRRQCKHAFVRNPAGMMLQHPQPACMCRARSRLRATAAMCTAA